MPKKDRKGAKAPKSAADKAARWTVRGVPPRLQKAAGDAARARGLTLGQWLTEALDQALAREPAAPAEAAGVWTAAIEARLARLEASVLGAGDTPAAARGPRRAKAAAAG
jgi:hypothetical protein